MTKHLTEIECFEYASNLIVDEALLGPLKMHLTNCDLCAKNVEIEQKLTSDVEATLAVNEEIDVKETVLNYFTKPATNLVGVDVYWASIAFLFISLLLVVGEVTSFNEAFPQLTYTTLIASAISALLLVDFFFKYLKYKKGITS